MSGPNVRRQVRCLIHSRASAGTAHGYLAPPRMRPYYVRTQRDRGVGSTQACLPLNGREAKIVAVVVTEARGGAEPLILGAIQ